MPRRAVRPGPRSLAAVRTGRASAGHVERRSARTAGSARQRSWCSGGAPGCSAQVAAARTRGSGSVSNADCTAAGRSRQVTATTARRPGSEAAASSAGGRPYASTRSVRLLAVPFATRSRTWSVWASRTAGSGCSAIRRLIAGETRLPCSRTPPTAAAVRQQGLGHRVGSRPREQRQPVPAGRMRGQAHTDVRGCGRMLPEPRELRLLEVHHGPTLAATAGPRASSGFDPPDRRPSGAAPSPSVVLPRGYGDTGSDVVGFRAAGTGRPSGKACTRVC